VRVAVHQLEVAAQLLDAVDLTAALDLDGHVPAVGVATQDVDRPDGGHVLAPREREALAERRDVLGEQPLEVGLDAVLHEAGVHTQLVRGVVVHLVEAHAQPVLGLRVLHHPHRADPVGGLGLVGLDDVSGRKIKALSGGMRRRVALAQSLLGDPDLLVLDEPTAGLDPEQRLRFRELVSDRTADRTVILSTHQTEDVAALCQRVIVMLDGQVLFEGTPRELTQVADGRVWLADDRAAGARLSWRTADGAHRNIGEAPSDADLVAPTLEDGYLLLVGDRAFAEEAA